MNLFPQTEEDDYRVEDPFPTLFQTILGSIGIIKKPGDDDWDDYINKEEPSEGPQRQVPCPQHDSTVPFPMSGDEVVISMTADGADGEEDEDDIYWEDNETNVALAIYDVLSSPASVEAEEDAADAVLGVHEECEDDFIARCAHGYNEIDEKQRLFKRL